MICPERPSDPVPLLVLICSCITYKKSKGVGHSNYEFGCCIFNCGKSIIGDYYYEYYAPKYFKVEWLFLWAFETLRSSVWLL